MPCSHRGLWYDGRGSNDFHSSGARGAQQPKFEILEANEVGHFETVSLKIHGRVDPQGMW